MDWRCDLSGRVPALHTWNPDFKSQSQPTPLPPKKEESKLFIWDLIDKNKDRVFLTSKSLSFALNQELSYCTRAELCEKGRMRRCEGPSTRAALWISDIHSLTDWLQCCRAHPGPCACQLCILPLNYAPSPGNLFLSKHSTTWAILHCLESLVRRKDT
jgi:hypothetical protein